MKRIHIRLSELNDEGILYQAEHEMSFDQYKEFLILYKQNLLEDIINELEFKLNMIKNGNKEN